jgi:threonine-phosphate decarboxylase
VIQESHGGNIYLLAERLGIAESDIVDFSASINPLGVPKSVQAAMKENMQYLFNYPDPDTKRLRLKISEHTGVSPDSLICGNGSTELIYLIVRALRPARVLIPQPTFSEYERAVKSQGSGAGGRRPEIKYFYMEKENNFDINIDGFISAMSGGKNPSRITHHTSRSFDVVFLCNPNNPTGTLIKREGMLRIAAAAKELKCALVVDEAFIDFCPGASIMDEVGNNPYLIVLRSLTKMYALSGLRVGYAALAPSFLNAVREAKEPWTVNSLAQVAGIVALDDEAYRAETFAVIEKEKKALEEGLKRLGVTYFPSSANYYLLRSKRAQELASFLKERAILVRDCSNFPGLDSSYIRVAVKSKHDNMRLLEEISSCVE